jgi:hypothetical protein
MSMKSAVSLPETAWWSTIDTQGRPDLSGSSTALASTRLIAT